MFGYDSVAVLLLADAVGRIHPDDRPGVEAAIASALDPQGSGEYHARYRVVRPDGSLHWIEAVGTGKFAGEGAERCAVRLAGMLWNVTERQQFIETLQQADAHKDEFLAMLAYELRNPLAPLTNALKLLDRAEPLIERGRSAAAVEIRVADKGIGIGRAKMSQLFELFHQIDATLDRAQGGLGIGLALVRRLFELHGGTGVVESAGRASGATFTVRLPHAEAVSDAD